MPDELGWRRFGPDSAERAALVALSEVLGVPLRPRALELRPGTMFEVEGVDPESRYLFQVVVNRGTYTSQQRNKVLADMFKLLWLRATRFPEAEVGLVLSETTAEAFKPRSWTSLAARELGFALYVVTTDRRVTKLASDES
ncbi:hypothetical protein GCM10022263_37690 [Nocardioides daeguensis]|uniref:Uncharacterized protein n=2 Tax=Nocardioides daeguensis TaxID=908359 RepID=A0ABP6W940_9ACTN